MTRPTLTGTPDAVPTVELAELVEGGNLEVIDRWLAQADVVEIADELSRLPREQRAVPFRLLPRDRALEVFELLDPSLQQELLEGLRDANVRQLFEDLDPDDRARLTEEMPAKVARRLLAGLSPNERRLTSTLLGYPEDSAGRLMSPEVASLRAGISAADALERLRRIGEGAETIYALPVTDDHRRLVGMLGLRDLVLAPPEKPVGDLMDTEVFSARVDTDQEEVAQLARRYNLVEVPVVDVNRRLLGAISAADVIDVIDEEATEDIQRLGGVGGDETVLDPPRQVFRTRLIWRLVNLGTAVLAASVIGLFESSIHALATLAVFMPIVASMGGIATTQTATVAIRGLAVGDLTRGILRRVLWKEVWLGLTTGAANGLVIAVIAYLWKGLWLLSVILGLAMVLNMLVAAVVGTLVPVALKTFRVDPAIASGVIITTFTDVCGFFSFLGLATLLIRFLL